jgi:hypothetical protein
MVASGGDAGESFFLFFFFFFFCGRSELFFFFFFLQSNPRRGGGHESNDGNKIMLEAYGRYMLVANSGEEGWAFSSWSQNTIGVDGQGQSRVSLPRHGAYSTPMDGRWYTSANFDFAESTYRYPYGSITTVQVCGKKKGVFEGKE